MAVLTIPTKFENPAYEMQVELERVVYTFRLRFNYRMARWIMDLATRDGTDLICGIPLLTGVDLIGKYRFDGLPPGDFQVYDTTQNLLTPGFSDLGKTVFLLYFESGTDG